MFWLRYLYLVSLTVWVGGMLVLGGIVAPATFGVLQGREGDAAGRVLAGAVFGDVLRRFHVVALAAGLLMLGALVSRAVLGPRPMRFAVRTAIVAAMLALMSYSGYVLTPQIERMQTAIGVSVRSLPPADPRRARFGRLHAVSTALMGINALGGLVLLAWEIWE
jgi:uncharacterized membrane protein